MPTLGATAVIQTAQNRKHPACWKKKDNNRRC